jgi:regulator of protease activity HflC (stomatin/prohibitin superfamily)
MGELFARLLDNLRELWPVKIIHSYERGVRFKMGQVTEPQLMPGWYLFWPFFWSIYEVSVVEDVLDLPSQSITTKDGKMVTFSANVSYEVTDAVALWTEVQDFEVNLARVACGHLALKVREWEWIELQAKQKELESSLKGTLTTRVKSWGVRVLECRLTDFVQAKQIRLVP